MKRKKPSAKKIKSNKDIDNLRERDVVKVFGYGRMRVDRIEDNKYYFTGRGEERGEITEVELLRNQLYPKNGSLNYKGSVIEITIPRNWGGKSQLYYKRSYRKLLEAGI